MRIDIICCDRCGEEIPKVTKKDISGEEREFYRFGTLDYGYYKKVARHYIVGLDLCERCAGEISLEMLKAKMDALLGK